MVNARGFTLIELMVALAIVGLMLSIAVPRYFGSVTRAEESALKENLHALLADLMKAKPSSSKGVFLQKVSLSSTMGLGIPVDQSTLPV